MASPPPESLGFWWCSGGEGVGWGGGMHKIPFSISGFRREARADPPTDRGRQQGDVDRPRPVAEHHHHCVDILCSWRRAPYGLQFVFASAAVSLGGSQMKRGGGVGCLFKLSVSGVGQGMYTVGCPKSFFAPFPYSSLD